MAKAEAINSFIEDLIEEYLEQQLEDLRRFVLIAVMIRGLPKNEKQLRFILRKAKNFVLRHGRPTPKRVREALKKD